MDPNLANFRNFAVSLIAVDQGGGVPQIASSPHQPESCLILFG